MSETGSETGSKTRSERPRERLAKLLFSNGADGTRANDEWAFLFQAAARWSVAPQLAAAIRSRGWEGVIEGWPEFKRLFLATHTRSMLRASKGVAALCHLEKSGIPALAFKGIASMAWLYPTPADRTVGDADLLVTPEHVPAALARLAEIGFQPAAGQEFEKVERFLDKSPGFAGNKAIALYGPMHGEIDLHWSIGLSGTTPMRMIERSENAMLFGSQIRVPSAVDAMVLTARHTVRENFTIDHICRDLLDVRLWCDKLARSGELTRILIAIHESANAAALLAMIQILATYNEDSPSAEAARFLSSISTEVERKTAGELADLFFEQVKEGPLSKDIFYLAHTKPLRQILAGVRTNWREYRGVMRSFEEQLDGQEMLLSTRTRLLATAVRSVSRGQFRAIRTLARLKYDV